MNIFPGILKLFLSLDGAGATPEVFYKQPFSLRHIVGSGGSVEQLEVISRNSKGNCIILSSPLFPANPRKPISLPLQVLSLSSKGIRVLAVEGPVCWSEGRWCTSFRNLLYHFNVDKVIFPLKEPAESGNTILFPDWLLTSHVT
eukprot:sb/3474055/